MSDILINHASNGFLSQLFILPIILNVATVVCSISLLFCMYRLLRGPSLGDRAIALDASGVTVMSLIVIYSIKQGTNLYMSAVLVIAILGFIGVVSLAKYIQGGNIVDSEKVLSNAGGAIDGRYDPKRPKKVDIGEMRDLTKGQLKEMVGNLNKDIKKDFHKLEEHKKDHDSSGANQGAESEQKAKRGE